MKSPLPTPLEQKVSKLEKEAYKRGFKDGAEVARKACVEILAKHMRNGVGNYLEVEITESL
jgi:hypothetical protein